MIAAAEMAIREKAYCPTAILLSIGFESSDAAWTYCHICLAIL